MKWIETLKEEDHRNALYATIVFIMLMILFFLLASMEVPDPPLEEKIIEVEIEFGSEFSGGSEKSENTKSEETPKPVTESAIKQDLQEEETVVVVSGKGKSKTSKSEKKPDKVTEPQPDKGLGFPVGGNGGEGGGTDKGFGKGGGVGEGGEGHDEGKGNTVNKKRKVLSKGRVPGNSQEEGRIALDIYVNQFGKVVRTQYRESASNSGSAYLKELAEKTARTYQYEKIPGSPVQHVGYIVFSFRKQ